jgi:hypothetical protein
MTQQQETHKVRVRFTERCPYTLTIPLYWRGKKISNGIKKLKRKIMDKEMDVDAAYVPWLVDEFFAHAIDQCGFDKAPEGVPFWPEDGTKEPGRIREQRITQFLNGASEEKLLSVGAIARKVEAIIKARTEKKLTWEDCDRLLTNKQIEGLIEWLETCPSEEEKP